MRHQGPEGINTICRLSVPASVFRSATWQGGGAGIAVA